MHDYLFILGRDPKLSVLETVSYLDSKKMNTLQFYSYSVG